MRETLYLPLASTVRFRSSQMARNIQRRAICANARPTLTPNPNWIAEPTSKPGGGGAKTTNGSYAGTQMNDGMREPRHEGGDYMSVDSNRGKFRHRFKDGIRLFASVILSSKATAP